MSILDMFKTQPATPPAAAPAQPGQQSTPGNIPPEAGKTVDNPVADPNGVLPAGVVTPEKEPAPLEEFGELWDNPVIKEGETAPKTMFDGLTAEVFQNSAKKMDFGRAVTPEHLQAITEGGEGAAKAFLEAINLVGQQVYAQSSYANTRLMQKGLGEAKTGFMDELPTHVNSLTAKNNRVESNPALNNPAAAPIISAVEAQLAQKHPNATATELTEMAENYLNQFADIIQQPGKTKAQQVIAAETEGEDWDAFLLS